MTPVNAERLTLSPAPHVELETVDSTNRYALSHFDELRDGTVITALQQKNGRGRFQKSWISRQPDNIYATIVLKPTSSAFPLAAVTHFAAVTVASVLVEYGIRPKIKWPNDILIDGKKICGILAESVIHGATIRGIALGIGVNLNLSPRDIAAIDQPATALNLELNQPVTRRHFLDRLCHHFYTGYPHFCNGGFSSIRSQYLRFAGFFGQSLTVTSYQGRLQGEAAGIDPSGALLLRDEHNFTHTILTGDVTCWNKDS